MNGACGPADEHAPFGSLVTSADGVLEGVDTVLLAWLGYLDPDRREQAGALAGRSFTDLLKPGARVVWLTHHVPRLEQTGSLEAVAVDLVRADGSMLPVLLTATLVPSAGQPGVRIAVVKAAERRAYEQDLLMARLAAERAEWRMSALQQVTEACAGAVGEAGLLAGVAAAVTDCLEVEAARLWLPSGHDGELVASSVMAVDSPVRAIVDAAWSGAELVAPPSVGAGLQAAAATPVGHGGDVLGVLQVDLPGTWRGTRTDLEVLRVMASIIGGALVRVRLHARLERLALFDDLTGLPNRTLTLDLLERALASAERGTRPVAVLFADLDGFKGVNDRHGHATGDEALRTAASRLRSAVRGGDSVGRLGGDEFVVICPEADEEVAGVIASRVHAAFADDLSGDTPGLPAALRVGVSVGVAIGRPPFAPGAAEALVDTADAAMYAMKRAVRM